MDQNDLMHYGVKGMKWGVRKKYYNKSMDNDMVIKKGSTIQNISRDQKRRIGDSPVYGSHKKSDNNAYAGWYANQLNFYGYDAIKNDLKVIKDIKIPSEKKAVENFYEMYKKDPKGVAKSIARSKSDIVAFNKIESIRSFNEKRYEKQLLTKGEKWIKTKGYEMFNQSIMSDSNTKARTEYFNMLINKGYSGIRDVNDINNSGVEEPIIYFNAKNTLKNVKSSKLTESEIELAMARKRYDDALKKDSLINRIVSDELRDSKKNLERLEKRR